MDVILTQSVNNVNKHKLESYQHNQVKFKISSWPGKHALFYITKILEIRNFLAWPLVNDQQVLFGNSISSKLLRGLILKW